MEFKKLPENFLAFLLIDEGLGTERALKTKNIFFLNKQNFMSSKPFSV